MISSLMLGPFSFITELFKALFDLIPKVIYLLYASLACILDVLQLFFRKLAGLDVYYVDGKAVTGDLVTNFITGILQPFLPGIDKTGNTYPILSTVFWSMIVFGLIICFACTIVAIIKSHYNYDEKAAKGPMQYVYTAGKAVLNMIAVPLIVVLGLWVSEGILTALDTITSISSGTVVELYGDKVSYLQSVQTVKTATGNSKDVTYIYYDIFGYGGGVCYGKDASPMIPNPKEIAKIGSSNQTFSGSLFRTAAYNANRVRTGQLSAQVGEFTGAANSDLPLFANAGDDNEKLAEMIDTAFACALHTKEGFTLDYEHTNSGIVSLKYFTQFLGMRSHAFSKFNVGLVWYYYDLWQFNFIVGFAGVIVCVSIFINIVLGLMTRLIMCVGLFLIAPPLFGLSPLDGGEAGKNWRKNFMEQVLMAYGAVVGMNIVLLILPYLNEIDFFNIAIADYFARTLFIIVGLITIKAFIAVVSKLVGGADANKAGDDIKKEVGSVAAKATKMTVGAAKLGKSAFDKFSPVKLGMNALAGGAGALAGKIKDTKFGQGAAKVGKKAKEIGKNAWGAIKNPNEAFMAAGHGILKAGIGLQRRSTRKQAQKTTQEFFKQKNRNVNVEMDSALSELRTLYGTAGKSGKVDAKQERQLRRKMTELGFSKSEMKNMETAVRSKGTAVTDADLGIDVADRKVKAEQIRRQAEQAALDRGKSIREKSGRLQRASTKHAESMGAHMKRARGTDGFQGVKTFLDSANDAFKGDALYKEAKETIWKPEDYTQTTAKHTGFQSELQAYQAQHPGAVPESVIKNLKKKYGIKD